MAESVTAGPPPVTASSDTRLFDMLSGYRRAQLVYLMARLDIADLLAAGPRTSTDLARDCDCDERALDCLLRALAAEDLLHVTDPSGYTLSPLGALLRSDAPGKTRRWALFAGQEQYRAWAASLHTIRTGTSGFEHEYGQDFWAYLTEHPARGGLFQSAMDGSAHDLGRTLAAAFDFSGYHSVVDVGGGCGAVLAGLLAAYPHLHGTLLDVAATEPDPRWTSVADSFFEQIPAGADIYLLCRVLSDWDDTRAGHILDACCRAMRRESRLLIVGRTGGRTGPMLDLHLLVMTGGWERTPEQQEALLNSHGLRVVRSAPLQGADLGLTEATR